MSSIQHFRLPDAGEGLTEAEIVSWRVAVGDRVKINDALVEIETAKSLVELPSPFEGTVTEIMVAEGDTVDVGTPIIAVDTGGGDGAAPAAAPERNPVLVGYGPQTKVPARRARVAPNGTAATPAPRPAGDIWGPAPEAPVDDESVPEEPFAPAHALAKPPIRKLARDLGVDLGQVPPTGPGGVVTREDVESAARASRPAAVTPPGPPPARSLPDPASEVTRIPIRGVRKSTAAAMVASAFTAPHVSAWMSVDVTRTMQLLERLRGDREFAGVKLSPLLLVAKAVLLAVRRHPGINAHWDARAQEIVIRHRVNLGIAAATPRGLIVPNIKRADELSLRELAEALANLTATAREGRTTPNDSHDGTITITNLGVFGLDSGTPILNPGESAIVCLGKIHKAPWVHKGKVKARWVTQVAVSFDHRLVDGDLGGPFLADIAALLEDPSRAMVWS